ncbi:hypothetical protein [Pseudomonas syringae]|nr:hypothetical protein [Pseudomonas syringae]
MLEPNDCVDAMRRFEIITEKMVSDVGTLVTLVHQLESTFIRAGMMVSDATLDLVTHAHGATLLPDVLLNRELKNLNHFLDNLKDTVRHSIETCVNALTVLAFDENNGSPDAPPDPIMTEALQAYQSRLQACISTLESLSEHVFNAEVTVLHSR